MTSKLVVNTIEADTGISSVSFASSISMSSTSKFHFSNAGIDIGADTNINRPTAGVLGFNINSSEKARIDSSGRVLIGTTTVGQSSGDDLTIATSGSTGITLRAASGNAGNILFSDGTSGDDQQRGILQYHHSDNSMRFFTNAVRRMTINSSGSVAIGTDSPTGNALTLGGTAAAVICQNPSSGYGANQGFYFGNGNGTIGYVWNYENDQIRFATNNTERLRIDSSGRLFLGLTSSSFPKRLNIQGSSGSIIALNNNDTTSYAADTNTSIEFGLNTGNTGNQNGACEIRAFKENGTNGNNSRGLSFYTGTNGGSPIKRLVVHPEGWVEKTNQISLARYGNSNLTIPNNTETVLTHFGSLGYETGGANSYWGSNKFTCPVAGMYMVYVKINLNANTGWGHDAYLAIRKNGTTGWFSSGVDVWYDLLGANSEYYRGLFSFMNVPCAKNDEIDFVVRQNSYGTRTLFGSMCYFNIYHLG